MLIFEGTYIILENYREQQLMIDSIIHETERLCQVFLAGIAFALKTGEKVRGNGGI